MSKKHWQYTEVKNQDGINVKMHFGNTILFLYRMDKKYMIINLNYRVQYSSNFKLWWHISLILPREKLFSFKNMHWIITAVLEHCVYSLVCLPSLFLTKKLYMTHITTIVHTWQYKGYLLGPNSYGGIHTIDIFIFINNKHILLFELRISYPFSIMNMA